MPRFLIFIFLISTPIFAKEMPDSELAEERSLDEALEVVERSKKDRESFDKKGPERGMASEEELDPGFQKEFDKMMQNQDQY